MSGTNESNIMDVASSLFKLLSPLSSEDRNRAIKGVLHLLGESSSPLAFDRNGVTEPAPATETGDFDNPRVRAWMVKHGITRDDLEQFLHIDGHDIQVLDLPIADTSKAKRTLAAYLTTGLVAFLKDPESTFTDEAARSLCANLGCYDNTNHAKILKKLARAVIGDKQHLKLTAVGLNEVAASIKSGSLAG